MISFRFYLHSNGSLLAKTQIRFVSTIQEIRDIPKVVTADLVVQSLKEVPTLMVDKTKIYWEGKLKDAFFKIIQTKQNTNHIKLKILNLILI